MPLTGIALSCYFSKFQKPLTAFSKRTYIFSFRKTHPLFNKFMHHCSLYGVLFENSACPPNAGRWLLEAGSYFVKQTQFQLAKNRKITLKSPKSPNSKYKKTPNEPNLTR